MQQVVKSFLNIWWGAKSKLCLEATPSQRFVYICDTGEQLRSLFHLKGWKKGKNNSTPRTVHGRTPLLLQIELPDPFRASTGPEEMKTRKTICAQNNKMEFHFGFTLKYSAVIIF